MIICFFHIVTIIITCIKTCHFFLTKNVIIIIAVYTRVSNHFSEPIFTSKTKGRLF